MPGGADARQRGRTHARSDAKDRRGATFSRKARGGERGARENCASGDYDAALSPFCDLVDIWRTVYLHRLEVPAAIVAWVEGAGLRPYLAPLAADEREEYLSRYLEAITAAYPRQAWGGVLMPFPGCSSSSAARSRALRMANGSLMLQADSVALRGRSRCE